jgi:UDP-N-acetylmuramate--alanine ligase
VEPDHLDYFGGESQMRRAFSDFLAACPGPRVVCADEPGARALAGPAGALTYGTSAEADYVMSDVVVGRSSASYGLANRGHRLGSVKLSVPGLHNARNSAAAIVAALELGASFDAAQAALSRYAGVARRFEFRGTRDGITYVDDYAHLPGEVSAALAAAEAGNWSRIVVVFQPHRYSRTAALWSDFANAFDGADLLVVTDVYASGEAPRPGVSGKLIIDAVLGAHPDRQVAYLPEHRGLVSFLRDRLRPGDLCLTLGAGDLTALPSELLGETS